MVRKRNSASSRGLIELCRGRATTVRAAAADCAPAVAGLWLRSGLSWLRLICLGGRGLLMLAVTALWGLRARCLRAARAVPLLQPGGSPPIGLPVWRGVILRRLAAVLSEGADARVSPMAMQAAFGAPNTRRWRPPAPKVCIAPQCNHPSAYARLLGPDEGGAHCD